MARRILARLFGDNCSHRFSWPRADSNGQHYQVCLICGVTYRYDWNNMHRTDRLVPVNARQG